MDGQGAIARGFSLVELLVTIGIVAILAAIALPNFHSTMVATKNTETANTLYLDIKTAQAEAIRRGVPVLLAPASGTSWGAGWCVTATLDSTACSSSDTNIVVSRSAIDPLFLLTSNAPAIPSGPGAGLQFASMGNVSNLTGAATFRTCQQSDSSSSTQQLVVQPSGSLLQSRLTTASTATDCCTPAGC